MMRRINELQTQIQAMDERILVLESTIHTILEELEVGTNGEFAGRIRKDIQSLNRSQLEPSSNAMGQSNMVFLLNSD